MNRTRLQIFLLVAATAGVLSACGKRDEPTPGTVGNTGAASSADGTQVRTPQTGDTPAGGSPGPQGTTGAANASGNAAVPGATGGGRLDAPREPGGAGRVGDFPANASSAPVPPSATGAASR